MKTTVTFEPEPYTDELTDLVAWAANASRVREALKLIRSRLKHGDPSDAERETLERLRTLLVD